MVTDALFRCEDAYAADLAATPGGWVLGAISLAGVDDQFIRNMEKQEWQDVKALLRPGQTYQAWSDAVVAMPATLHLLAHQDGETTTLMTATAEQFSGIAAAGGGDPAFLWTAYDGEQWSVSLYRQGEVRTLYAGGLIVLDPSITRDAAGTLWYAWTTREGSSDTIQITSEDSSGSFDLAGRHPSLTAVADGVAVCFERFQDGESHIYFATAHAGSPGTARQVSSHQPLNFLPRCTTDSSGQVVVAWESSPAWGFDTRVEQLRQIELKQVNPDDDAVTDVPGTDGGVLPIPTRSYNRTKGRGTGRGMYLNMNPSNPRLLPLGDDLVCTFRMFAPLLEDQVPEQRPRNRDAWDLGMTRWHRGAWSPPQRISSAAGFSHHPYGATVSDGQAIVAAHCFDHTGYPPRQHRIEVLRADGELPPIHQHVTTFDPVPLAAIVPITNAPALPDGPEGHRLVFGDLHNHSSYSSCYPALDGTADDNICWQRDALNHEIICLTDHLRLSDADYRQRLDVLEREHTTDRVPIYSIEWAKPPWHHTNFFTYDKQVMKQLRQILLAYPDLATICDAIVEELPANTVAAIRHYHRDTHTYCYDQRVEWGMEVLHGRGDEMATEPGMAGGPSPAAFPTNFIEREGAKLALIGGSDHHMSRLGACVTGFWVPELTGEAIFDAWRRRRTIACANGKLALWVHSGAVTMGQVGKAQAPVSITASVASPLPVERLSLWRDGAWIQDRRQLGQQVQHTFVDGEAGPGEHYYIVRAQTELRPDYPKGPIIGYSAPLWLASA